jgi:hypothetical protein
MHTWVNGWDWPWMTLMMGFWLVVLRPAEAVLSSADQGAVQEVRALVRAGGLPRVPGPASSPATTPFCRPGSRARSIVTAAVTRGRQ